MKTKLADCRAAWVLFGPNSDGQTWKRGFIWRCPQCRRPHGIEFRPVIGPTPVRGDSAAAMDDKPAFSGQPIWERYYGDNFGTICISPAIDVGCCSMSIQNGELLSCDLANSIRTGLVCVQDMPSA